jgi:hypothetical protein
MDRRIPVTPDLKELWANYENRKLALQVVEYCCKIRVMKQSARPVRKRIATLA